MRRCTSLFVLSAWSWCLGWFRLLRVNRVFRGSDIQNRRKTIHESHETHEETVENAEEA
jgi:hypothetical protein